MPDSQINPSSAAATSILQVESRHAPGTGEPKFFLGREGVAFGPYTEFQLLESVRLGIFERHDLVLAEDGTEWLEIAQQLPASRSILKRTPDQPPVPSPIEGNDKDWQTFSGMLPVVRVPLEHSPARRTPAKTPLSEHQLREHEILCANTPVASFLKELMRGRLAFAAVPVVLLFIGLLTSAAVLKGRDSSTRVPAVAVRAPHHSPAVQTAAKTDLALTPVSLASNQSSATTRR